MDPWIWSILLIGLGLVFLVLEFLLPSAGLLSVLAGACLVASLVVAFLDSFRFGVIMLLAICFLLPTVLTMGVRLWPQTPIGRLILIQRPESPDDVLPETEQYRGLKKLIGRYGKAQSTMLPSGSVEVDDRPYDAISEGMAIEAGQLVQIVDVRTNRLVVRPASENELARRGDPRDLLTQPIDSLGLEDFQEDGEV